MRPIGLLLICSLISAQVTAQPLHQWVSTFQGPASVEVKALAVDDDGNVYATGYFSDSTDFDPGPGTNYMRSRGWDDIFLAKLNFDGDPLWITTAGGPGYDQGLSIDVDADGNVYATGSFRGTAIFGSGAEADTIVSSSNLEDIFVVKYDTEGTLQWVHAFGSTNIDIGHAIDVDDFGNPHVTGYFRLTVDFDPGLGDSLLTGQAAGDAFVLKLSTDGDFIWASKLGGTGNNPGGRGIVVAPDGSVVSVGRFQGTVHLNPSNQNDPHVSNGGNDIYVSKLNASGQWVWGRSFGGGQNDGIGGVDIDAVGNVFVVGAFNLSVDFDPGTGDSTVMSLDDQDLFILKLDASGNFAWVRTVGQGNDQVARDVAVTNMGDIMVTGYYYDNDQTVDFDPAGTAPFTSNGLNDVFVLALRGNGDFMTAWHVGSVNGDEGLAIALGEQDDVHIAGIYQGELDFDPGPDQDNVPSPTSSYTNGFVWKLGSLYTSVNEPASLLVKMTAFPNPASSVLTLTGNTSDGSAVHLMDLSGRAIQTFLVQPGAFSLGLDVSSLPSGVYLLKCGAAIHRFVKAD